MPKLAVYRGRHHQFDHWIQKDSVVIGRSSEADVPIDSPISSRKHCRVLKRGAAWYLEEMGAKNGLFVNGKAVTVHRLRNGDSIEIGETVLLFQQSADEARDERAQGTGAQDAYRIRSTDLERALDDREADSKEIRHAVRSASATTMVSPEELARMMEEMKKKQHAHLAVDRGGQIERVVLDGGKWTLGWEAGCDVKLPGSWPWPWGRRPATLRNLGQGRFAIERDSRWCAVKVGGKSVVKSMELKDNDAIRVGPASLRFLGASEVAEIKGKADRKRR